MAEQSDLPDTARRRARELTERRRRIASAPPARAPLRPVVLAVLLLATAWLLVGPWVLAYPLTTPAQNAALRETGAAIVVGLVTLRERQVGASRPWAVLVVLVGALLLLSAAGQPEARVRVNEMVTAAVVVIGGAALVAVPGGRRTGRTPRTEGGA